jgi:ubiquitin carboxyl-terminal hydrolase 7
MFSEISQRPRVSISLQLSSSYLTAGNRAAALQNASSYTGAREYYDYLLNRVTLKFFPRFAHITQVEPFDLALNRKMSYDQFSTRVGEKLNVDPTHLRFSTVNATTSKPKTLVRRNPNLNLYQILNPQFSSYSVNQRNDALYFEILEMSLSELDMKKAMKIIWVSEGLTKEVLLMAHFTFSSNLLTI